MSIGQCFFGENRKSVICIAHLKREGEEKGFMFGNSSGSSLTEFGSESGNGFGSESGVFFFPTSNCNDRRAMRYANVDLICFASLLCCL